MLPIILAIAIQLIGGTISTGSSAPSSGTGTVQTAITGEVAG